ncbi:MAG: glycosyltransferase family 1 protein [Gemmataceae bacterium]
MRVVVNGLSAVGPRTGVGYYTTELTAALQRQADADTSIDLFRPDWLGGAKAWLRRLRGRIEKPTAALPGAAARSGWKARWFDRLRRLGLEVYRWNFRRRVRAGKFDLYHEPSFFPIACDVPTVVSVHDLSVLLHPEWHPADRVAQYQREFERNLSRAVHVVAISDHGRQEIIRTLGLPGDRVTRTHLGVRDGLRPLPSDEVQERLAALGLPPRYLLHVGTIEPRKNLLMLLRAYCALPVTVRLRNPLVLAGGWGWKSEDVRDYLHQEARHRGVHYLGYTDEADLAVLYNGARALLFPSHYEGFGLPTIEMFACGGAVLASTAGAVAETAGRRACLIDPNDLAGWRDAMERVCTDDDWWKELRRDAVEAARPYTWDRCAAQTLDIYARVLHGAPTRQLRAA